MKNDLLEKLLALATRPEKKFGPSDLIVNPQVNQPAPIPQPAPVALTKPSLDQLEDKGYETPNPEAMKRQGAQDAMAWIGNKGQNSSAAGTKKRGEAPLVGKGPAEELLGKYSEEEETEEPVRSPASINKLDEIIPTKSGGYDEAIRNRDDMLSKILLADAGNTIGSAIAGSKNTFDAKPYMDLANNKTKDYADKIKVSSAEMDQNNEAQLNDPNSDISAFMREAAIEKLKKINPNSPIIGKLDNMTAKQLENVFGKEFLGQAKNDKAVAAGQFIDANTGHPLHFDEGSRKWVNGITGKTVDESVVIARPIAYTDPIQGNRGFFTAQGMKNPGTGAGVEATNASGVKSPSKTLGDFKASGEISPNDTKILDKDKEGFETAAKDTMKIIDGLSSVDALVDEAMKNPNAYSSIGGIVGGLFEPGKLTDEDAKRYVQSSGILNKIRDLEAKYVSGTMSPELANEIKSTAKAYRETLDQIARNKAIKMAKASKMGLTGAARKDIQEDVIADYYYQSKFNVPASNNQDAKIDSFIQKNGIKDRQEAINILKSKGYIK